ncbi:MAG: ATP-dependent helicase HrpB [Halioglobus sp.]|jgi:ATP-dependent helicase HrpB
MAMLPGHFMDLPISEVLDEIRDTLHFRHQLVLQAPPGAGKTTVVPLALLSESWLLGQKILLLEPRRVAARAAAVRMAELLGESVGETVGYRIRQDTCVGPDTRIEVITEGILTRMVQSDPSLDGIGLIIFDEFHERNLDSDLGLALIMQSRHLFRVDPPLKLIVMSATLDGEAVSNLLGGAPMITSDGRQFAVDVTYGASYQLSDSIIGRTVQATKQALEEHNGSILVFLPGQGEINRVFRDLRPIVDGYENVELHALYGGLPLAKQQQAIAPAAEGVRKVVLSTNIAESSLTIDGVEIVIDAGLIRVPVFDPSTGMTRLDTRRLSRSSAEQRAGRAGRLSAGHCYRLWSEEQHGQLIAKATPEILQADLAPLALQLLAWGVDNPDELDWLDPPPSGPYSQAISQLIACSAVYKGASGIYQLTPHGVRLAQMPLHPRLSHMLLVGCDIHATETACLLAALLSERNPIANQGVDLVAAMQMLTGQSRCPQALSAWLKRTRKQADRFNDICNKVHKPRKYAIPVSEEDVLGVLLASAYSDRIARLRPGNDQSQYQMSNGRSAVLPVEDALAGEPWLAVAEVGGHVGESADKIYSATALNPEMFEDVLSPLLCQEDFVEWDKKSNQFIAESRIGLGNLVLSSKALDEVPDQARNDALLGVVRKEGLALLPWDKKLERWRARVMLLRAADLGTLDVDSVAEFKTTSCAWPDLSNATLLATLEEWLAPYLNDVRRLEDFQKIDLKSILYSLLPWPLPLDLERLAPEHLVVPSGSRIAVDYNEYPPVLAVKLQEMFGCEDTPRVADGKIPVLIHLLSPAGRPLQITQDLAGFWRSSYEEVKKEMRGRYPRHPWPDDPLQAYATAHTKKRSQKLA